MADFFSRRFGKFVRITHHARESMSRRNIDEETLHLVVEEGEIKRRDDENFWVFKRIPGRSDNLVCVAATGKAAIVVKTVMVNWELEDEA